MPSQARRITRTVLPHVVIPAPLHEITGACSGRSGERRQPGFAGEGSGYSVKRGEAVGGSGVEVAADAAPAGEGGLGVPVAGDGLVPLGGLGALLGDVVRPLHGGLAGK